MKLFENPFLDKRKMFFPISMLILFLANFIFEKSMPSLIMLLWGTISFLRMCVTDSKIRDIIRDIGFILLLIIIWITKH